MQNANRLNLVDKLILILVPVGLLFAQPAQKPLPEAPKNPPAALAPASVKLPVEEVSEFWRLASEASMAQMALERTPQADALKAAMGARQAQIDHLTALCGPGATLVSASPEEALKLGLKKDTPICTPKAPEAKLPPAAKVPPQ